jgi:uncharacterized glyoxalase superfamily protein PhnB
MKQVLTILAVDDFVRAREFYLAAFGFALTVDVPVYAEFEMEDGRRLGIYQRESFGVNTGVVPKKILAGELSGAELYFHCDDPETQCEKLRAAGATELSPWQTRAWGGRRGVFSGFRRACDCDCEGEGQRRIKDKGCFAVIGVVRCALIGGLS